MAACGSLQHIFEKPLPENPTLLESLSSWNQIKPVKPMGQTQSSFTELFGELYFKDNSQPPLSSSSFPASPFPSSSCVDINPPQAGTTKLTKNDSLDSKLSENKRASIFDSFSSTPKNQYAGCHKNGETFSPMNHGSLQLCTEGLGFESSDDVENTKIDVNEAAGKHTEEKVRVTRHFMPENLNGELRRPRAGIGAFPPPISCIGRSGKPGVCFKSYRQDGRFVLKEVRVPTVEFLHACREDGRLKLHFVHPNDEISGEDEEDEDENFTEDDEQEGSEEKNSGEVDTADEENEG
ncbi:hypothetical protein Tsubulata_020127 [Turnera subulata]|uniref:FAF domain-containing protein n=1 Tax=Turnera subulata TaxID=218843 RepID=A0A9Q0G1S0_9ROSI|nr:hypothetical protein Tsubulata_020127 [Turnera subulata]